jgi:hypothetical protein
MMNATEALLSIARPVPPETPGPSASVVAIIRLCESRRSWFVTAVQRRGYAIEVVGYAPGCMHSAGSWFSLGPDFFEVAAEASGDRLEVELLKNPVPLNMLEDESL